MYFLCGLAGTCIKGDWILAAFKSAVHSICIGAAFMIITAGMTISSKRILAAAVISLLSISSPVNAQGDGEASSIPTDIDGIRLVNGTYGNHMGRVEVLYNGTWGTICDDFWSIRGADVACRMLGYEDALCGVSNGRFGAAESAVPILMDNVLCRGNEQTLDHCDFNGWGNHGCTHREDAGVICDDQSLIGTPDNIRLIESSTGSLTIGWTIPAFPKGIERIRFRFSYQSKGDSFSRTRIFTPRSDEAVINRTGAEINFTLPSLQKDMEYTIQIRAEARYQRRPFLCSTFMTGNFSNAVVFRTNDTLRQSNTIIRLVSPQSGLDFMGRLEVFHNNVWGTVCDDLFGRAEANVVCGVLNYTEGSMCAVRSAGFGEGEGQIWLDDVDCDSSDEVLEDCSFRPWGQNNCDHGDDVGVICRPRNYLARPVENFTVSHVASTSITVRWNRYEFPSEVSRTQFLLQYVSDPVSPTLSSIFIISGNENDYTFRGLQVGGEYNISIFPQVRFPQCRFSTLSGPRSREVRAVTRESAPTHAPIEFHVVVLNSNAAEVLYELPPIDSRNGIIRGFKIFVEEAGGDSSEMVIDVMGNSSLAYIVTGLKPATAYVVSMLAYTVADGPRTIRLTAITNSEGFDPIIVNFGINGNGFDKDTAFTSQTNLHIHCSPSHPANSTVDWFFSNGTKVGISNRNVREGHYANGTAVLQIASNRRLSYCDAGVYTCKVNTTSGREHRKNFTLIINNTPPAPSRPSALEVKQDSIAIEWDEDQCTGGHTIQSFTIQYFETDNNPIFPFFGFFWHIRNIDATLRNYTITGLDPETSYTIGVQATSVDGRVSFYSASTEIVTLPPAPSAPRDVTVRVILPLLVEVSWKVPAVTNGNIARYTVYAIPLVSTEPTRGKRQASATLPKTVKMVFPGSARAGNITLVDHSVTYQFHVSAATIESGDINEGELSAITINTTLFVPKPGILTPINLRSTVSTNSSITLLWNYPLPPVETIESFMVSYSAQVDWRSPGGTLVHFMDIGKATTTGTTITIFQLIPGTRYLFRVSAVTQKGRGAEMNLESQTERARSDDERLAFFQLRIGPIGSCIDTMDLAGNNTELQYQVRKGLAVELVHLCPTCGLTDANIKDDEFSCRGGLTNFIVYRARLVGTDTYSAPGLVSLMQSWVGSDTASIAIQSSSRLHLDASCPTSLDTLRSPDCPLATRPPISTTVGSPETKPVSKKPEGSTTAPSDMRVGLRAGEIGGIFIGTLIVVFLAVVIVLLLVVLLKPLLPRVRNIDGHSRMAEDKTAFTDIGSSQDGGHLAEDDLEKPSTNF